MKKSRLFGLLAAGILVLAMVTAAGTGSLFEFPLKQATAADQEEFSIVIIPDTQMRGDVRADVLQGIGKWIAGQKEELNIKMVMHVGDIVNNGANDAHEYQQAYDAFQHIVNADIPLILAAGNHDYDNNINRSRRLGLYNKYFGPHFYEGKPWFGGTYEEGQAENHYAVLDIDGQKYLFITLEFGPRDEVLAWADRLMAKFSDHRVIINTHSYMYHDGQRTREGSDHNPKTYKGAYGANDGEDMWQKLLKKHENMFAVFNGHHVSRQVSYRVDLGVYGNPVLQSFQNWQDFPTIGVVRVVKINPANDTVTMSAYNTTTNEYMHEPGYNVTIPMKKMVYPDIVFPVFE